MTLSILLVLALLAAVVVVFAFEWISVDMATLILLSILVLSGILTVEEAFSGFANEIIIILASIFVLSGALMKGGVLDHLSEVFHRVAGGSRSKVLLCVMPATSFISSFMNNTTTTAVMMPAIISLCRKSRLSAGKVLIPLAYASMLGGTCTLIGTSTNVAASGYVASAGLAPFSMFEFLPLGAAVCVMGILYMIVAGHRLLPETREAGYEEQYSIREFLSEVVVTPGSPLAGQALRDSRLGTMGLQVRGILRGGRRIDPEPSLPLAEGDLLLVQTTREAGEIRLGVSTRGALAWVAAARARALLDGRTQVGIDDLQELAVAALAHRIVPAQAGSGDQVALAQELVRELIATAPVPV